MGAGAEGSGGQIALEREEVNGSKWSSLARCFGVGFDDLWQLALWLS